MITEHTPVPWHVGGDGRIVYEETGYAICNAVVYHGKWDGQENAAFIVRAANAHDDLVAALEAWVDAFGWDEGPNSMKALRDSSRAALAKAKGE